MSVLYTQKLTKPCDANYWHNLKRKRDMSCGIQIKYAVASWTSSALYMPSQMRKVSHYPVQINFVPAGSVDKVSANIKKHRSVPNWVQAITGIKDDLVHFWIHQFIRCHQAKKWFNGIIGFLFIWQFLMHSISLLITICQYHVMLYHLNMVIIYV